MNQVKSESLNRRIPIRTKLLVGLAIPVLFVAFVSGVQANSAQSNLNRTHKEVTLALAAGGPTTYITALMDERNYTALWLLNVQGTVKLARVSSLAGARTETDKAQQAFASSLVHDGKEVQLLFNSALNSSRSSLAALRAQTDKNSETRGLKNAAAKSIYDSYSKIIANFHTANANAVRNINDAVLHRRADSIAEQTLANDLLSLMSRSASITLLQPATSDDTLNTAIQLGQYQASRQRAIDDLSDDPAGQAIVSRFYSRPSMTRFENGITKFIKTGKVDDVTQIIADAANPDHPNGTDAWDAARTSLVRRGNSLVSSAQDSRNVYVALFFLATGISLAFALLIARSISKPLISIAAQADEMATSTLPAAVGQILNAPIGQDIVEPKLAPIAVHSRDEVADVAVAINAVQSTALELAVEQAVQRRNFADTFLNLGRRVQGLITRQLEFITDLEDAEKDPEVLANLFKLDHLATRMRRNAESLVILAGVTRKDHGGDGISMIDTLRSALSEVDQFTRVEIGQVESATLPLSVAADVSHMLAELIENGLNFSPAPTPVTVTGERVGDHYHVTVVDRGSGMDAEQVATANRRLSGNESFTVAPSRYMGHYVAGHLATGLGVHVAIQSSSNGTIATVDLGSELVSFVESVPTPPAEGSTSPGVEEPSVASSGETSFKPAAPPKAPQSGSLGSLLAVHRRLSQPREIPEDNSPWNARRRGHDEHPIVEDDS